VTGIILLAIDGNTTCSEGPTTACADVFETTAGGVTLTSLGAIAAGIGAGFILTTIDFGGERDSASIGVQPARAGAVFSLDASF